MIRVSDDEEAIRIANDTPYGLSASVFSQNIARALAIARRVQSGMCHINGATVHDEAQMPFGGVKDSGYGRFGGRAGIDEFTELRSDHHQHGFTALPGLSDLNPPLDRRNFSVVLSKIPMEGLAIKVR